MHCTAVKCSVEQCSSVQCSAVQGSALKCSAVQCSKVNCNKVKCSEVHCSTVQCSALHCTARHHNSLHCTVINCTALYCIIMHSIGWIRAWEITNRMRVRSVFCEKVSHGLLAASVTLWVIIYWGLSPTKVTSNKSLCPMTPGYYLQIFGSFNVFCY